MSPRRRASPWCALDGERARIEAESAAPLETGVTSENLCYVIYTSGSTGRPKGVAMHHRGVSNYIHWGIRHYGADAGSGAPVFSSMAVDLTITNLLPLFCGHPVHFLPEENAVEALADAIRRQPGYGLIKITPTHLALLNDMLSPDDLRRSTKTLVVGADFLNAEPTVFWQEHAPGVRLMNEYGPTETVVGCSAYLPPPGRHREGPVPVGHPIQNLAFHVLDGPAASPSRSGSPASCTSAARAWRAATWAARRSRRRSSSRTRSGMPARGCTARATSPAGGRTATSSSWAARTTR